MTALHAGVARVVSAFSAVLHEAQNGEPDFAAFQRLLRDEKLGLQADERAAIEATDEARLATEIEAEILQRRQQGCWPHAQLRRPN